MAGSSKVLKIGVIAEEDNDVDVLYEFTSKLIAKKSFSFKQFVGHGCGKLRRKCGVWANNLHQRGCSHLVILHDLDVWKENELRAILDKSITGVAFRLSVVLIPIQELEAWLLSDAQALRKVFGMRQDPKTPARPERIASPKEYLGRLIWKSTKARYLNTIHNKKIAAETRIPSLAKCPSFSRYPIFLKAAKARRK